jgi:drug/metabolite transporter (DMT)-like permease
MVTLRDHPHLAAYLALACVCFFWGTTYLGIRIAVEQIPPAMLMCVRYTLSGGLILIGAWLSKARFPRGRELWITAVCGLLTIGLGTGALVFAEVRVPSGLASLFVATASFWMVGMDAAMPGGEPLHGPTIAAMAVGAAGAVLLFWPGSAGAGDAGFGSFGAMLAGFALIHFGYAGWGAGSILQRRMETTAHPIVSAGVQQFATGIAFATPALLGPPTHWTSRGIGATAYLAIFGGVIGYSAYVIAVTRLPVAITSIYSYINPLVAVLLGVWLYHEPFSAREGLAMGMIIVGVALVKRAQTARRVLVNGAPAASLPVPRRTPGKP